MRNLIVLGVVGLFILGIVLGPLALWQAGKAESRIAIQGMAEHGGRSADGFAQGMQMGHNSLLVTR